MADIDDRKPLQILRVGNGWDDLIVIRDKFRVDTALFTGSYNGF